MAGGYRPPTSRRLVCSSCGRRTSFVRDRALEETGVCRSCTDRAKKNAI